MGPPWSCFGALGEMGMIYLNFLGVARAFWGDRPGARSIHHRGAGEVHWIGVVSEDGRAVREPVLRWGAIHGSWGGGWGPGWSPAFPGARTWDSRGCWVNLRAECGEAVWDVLARAEPPNLPGCSWNRE